MSCDSSKVVYGDQLPDINSINRATKIVIVIGRKFNVTTVAHLSDFISSDSENFNVQTIDSNSIEFSGVGSQSDKLSALIKISQDVNNSIEVRDDGLYIPIPLVLIDDATTGVNTTWSSQKIQEDIIDVNTFASNIVVNIAAGKTFGKYSNGQTIPAINKTPKEVIIDALNEVFAPTATILINTSIRELGSSTNYSIDWTVTKKTNPITSIIVDSQTITPTGNNQIGSVNGTVGSATGIYTKNIFVSDGTLSNTVSTTLQYVYKIFYDSVSTIPINSAAVRGLTSRFETDSKTFNLLTGTINRIFTLAIPSTLSLSKVIDLDSLNLDITTQYIQSSISVNDAGGNPISYKLYTMSQAIPYISSHRHQITIV